MSRWKKTLIAVAILFVVFVAAIYAFLVLYDFNKFKPTIAKAVKDATGRELKIGGDIEFTLGLRPTLVVHDVTFQNASWSTIPDLVRVKRLETQVAVLPLITGNIDFARLVLIEPAVIVEFDSSGTSNFAFDSGAPDKEVDDSAIPPPPLIFSDILVENGQFSYRDASSDFKFSIRIDHLTGKIPGFDKALELNFKGAFDDIPFSLSGQIGPIWAWVETGYALPADFTVTAGGATAQIKGELRDPRSLKDLAFDVVARGSSVADIMNLAGLTGVPELGDFEFSVNVNDGPGKLAVDQLDIRIGSPELAALSLTGDVKDIIALQGINLALTVQGEDSAKLSQFGLAALPERGPFKLAAQISDPDTKVYAVSDLNIVLNKNEFEGSIDLNLADEIPFLNAKIASQKFRFGEMNLDLKINNPIAKPSIEKLDLKFGSPDILEISLNGVVDDLMELAGVNIAFQGKAKDLANLKQLTGRDLPVRGAFGAAGNVIIPVHKNLKVPDLKITIGKNRITGSLNMDLREERPQLEANLSAPKLDLPSVLLPELAGQKWTKGLSIVRPVKLAVRLSGFTEEVALKKFDLRAGTLKSAELRVTGSVTNLLDQNGVDLNFSLRGDDFARLEDITGQAYFFAPLPGQGHYAISGHITDSTSQVYNIKNFKLSVADTKLAGRLDLNLAGEVPTYEVQMSGPKFNMKPFPIPKEAAYAKLNQIDDLGPLHIRSKVTVKDGQLSMPMLDMRAGRPQLVSIAVKGSIKNITTQKGINLDFNIQGREVANLKEITGKSLPLRGMFGVTGKLTDPASNKYQIDGLEFSLGKNNITGNFVLDLSGKRFGLSTYLAADKFNLQPVTLPTLTELSQIEDLGPLKLIFNLSPSGQKLVLDKLDAQIGHEDLINVTLKGTIADLTTVRGMKLEFSAKGNDVSNFKKLGGPEIPLQGPFSFSGRFIDPAPAVYRLPDFNAVWGESSQSGWLELDLSAERPKLKGELSSDHLDLRPFLVEKEKTGVEKSQPGKPVTSPKKQSKANMQPSKSGNQAAKVFSAEPLPLDGLQVLDLDLKFRDRQVLLPALALDEVMLDVLLDNGNLAIKPFNFLIGGGKADFQFSLDSRKKPAALATALDIDQLAIGPMLDELGYERSVEGNLDADFNLDGSGDSIAAVMAGLNGDIRIAMSDGRADVKYLALLQKYLGSGILRMINPFEKKREYDPINCFVNDVEIKDGLAKIKILLDTDQTSIFGAGDINLKTERLDLGIKPTPKKGALPADFNFSLRQLSRPFRLGGTLAEPSLVIDPTRTAFVAGKLAGALALGPVGILAFFGDVSTGKKDPCAVALEASEKKKQLSQSEETETKNEEPKKKGFFQRLFGR